MTYGSLTAGETANLGVRTFSYRMTNENIGRGKVCVIDAGDVRIAKSNISGVSNMPVVVAVEAKDNSGGSAGDKNIMVVMGQEIVAVEIQNGTGSAISVKPGASLKIAATGDTPTGDGRLTPMTVGSDDPDLKCAEFITAEPNKWSRSATTPFSETISNGEVPEQPLAVAANSTAIGWVKLTRS